MINKDNTPDVLKDSTWDDFEKEFKRIRMWKRIAVAFRLLQIVVTLGCLGITACGAWRTAQNTKATGEDIRAMRNELRGDYETENELRGAFSK